MSGCFLDIYFTTHRTITRKFKLSSLAIRVDFFRGFGLRLGLLFAMKAPQHPSRRQRELALRRLCLTCSWNHRDVGVFSFRVLFETRYRTQSDSCLCTIVGRFQTQ